MVGLSHAIAPLKISNKPSISTQSIIVASPKPTPTSIASVPTLASSNSSPTQSPKPCPSATPVTLPLNLLWLKQGGRSSPNQKLHRAIAQLSFAKFPMHIITRKRLNEFSAKHPETKSSLVYWYRLVKTQEFNSFAELQTYFPSADQVGNLTVFNIGGNKARLIAAIHYNRKKIYIRAILTHTEYDRGTWRN